MNALAVNQGITWAEAADASKSFIDDYGSNYFYTLILTGKLPIQMLFSEHHEGGNRSYILSQRWTNWMERN